MALSCDCLEPRHSPYSYYLCLATDMPAVGTTFNVFSYDAFLAENRTHHLPNAEHWADALRVTQTRVYTGKIVILCEFLLNKQFWTSLYSHVPKWVYLKTGNLFHLLEQRLNYISVCIIPLILTKGCRNNKCVLLN